MAQNGIADPDTCPSIPTRTENGIPDPRGAWAPACLEKLQRDLNSHASPLPCALNRVIAQYVVFCWNYPEPFRIGTRVDIRDRNSLMRWRPGVVINSNKGTSSVFVHFSGYTAKWDEWLPVSEETWPPWVVPAGIVCGRLEIGQRVWRRSYETFVLHRSHQQATVIDISFIDATVTLLVDGVGTEQYSWDADVSILPACPPGGSALEGVPIN